MTAPSVSVLIDTYNYGHFVEQAIESVLSQDFPSDRMEILVVDDGSTDDTSKRVEKYSGKIQYFRKENGGQGSAFNYGFDRARGDFIFLLDADDYWQSNKLSRVMEIFESDPAGIVSNDYELSNDASGGSIPSNLPFVSGSVPATLKSLMQYRVFPTSCLAFRRETLQRLLPVPEAIKLQADSYLALLAIFIAPVRALPDKLTVYRIHGENLYSVNAARNTPDSQRRRYQTSKIILDEMSAWLTRNGFDTANGNIRAFLDQWTIFQQAAEFSVDPPTRWQVFSFLMRYNRTYRGQQNWKITARNYFSAVSGLVLGARRPVSQAVSVDVGRRV